MPDSANASKPRRAAEAPVAEAERLLHHFLEALPDAVALVDSAGLIVHANAGVETLFGYAPGALSGRSIELLMPERFRAGHAGHQHAYFAAPRIRRMGSGLRLIGLRQDRVEFPIDVALSPLVADDRQLVAAAIRDMSEYRQLETQLLQRNQELEEADRRKDQFLAMLAHELRNPLAALSQASDMLRRPGAEDRNELIAGVVERQTGHMLRLVEDLLDLTRIRRGTITLRRQPTDLGGVAVRAVEISRPLLDGRRHALDILLPAHAIRVDGDGTRLVQVVTNLLTNAARYTPEGGQIRLTLGTDADHALLKVVDNGIGIRADMLPRVFDLFTQAEPSGNDVSGGLGLGLALVRPLVEMHGGTVTAHSDGAGQGSEFAVRLPLLS
jgi:PAS domain S-box-containing protein